MLPRRWQTATFRLSVLLLVGCGGPGQTIDPATLATAQVAYDSAMDAIAAGDTATALGNLNVALQPGSGLPADIYVEARIQRAICLARVDRLADAHADLDHATEGAGDMSAVHVARAFVYSKEEKVAESKKVMLEAKKIRKSVKRIRE